MADSIAFLGIRRNPAAYCSADDMAIYSVISVRSPRFPNDFVATIRDEPRNSTRSFAGPNGLRVSAPPSIESGSPLACRIAKFENRWTRKGGKRDLPRFSHESGQRRTFGQCVADGFLQEFRRPSSSSPCDQSNYLVHRTFPFP